MFEEFKKFTMRGNVIDLAVGVIIGASFTGIVTSLVNDLLMPPVGLALGGVDFANFFIVLKGDRMVDTLAAAKAAKDVTINYGLFINAIINFMIIAFVLFLLLRQLNKLVAPQPATEAAPALTEENPFAAGDSRFSQRTRVKRLIVFLFVLLASAPARADDMAGWRQTASTPPISVCRVRAAFPMPRRGCDTPPCCRRA